MGVEEAPSAPPAPIAPSMGVEEVSATPLEEIMVCVIGVEEPPLTSVGENIDASAPGRAEDSGFSSWLRTISVGRWRNISGKWFLIGLVFVAIVLALAIGLILGTLATPSTPDIEVDNPCIICPNGITAGDDFVPNASSGNSMTCLELINSSTENESGSQTFIAFSSVYKISCCPATTVPSPAEDVNVAAQTKIPTETPTVDAMTPAPTPGEDENVAAPTKTLTETPTVDAMTLAPTTAPADDTTVATTTATSTLAPEVDDPCIICPNGITAGDDFVPNSSSGNSMTCLELINSSMDYESGSQMCSFGSLYKISCCPTTTAPTQALTKTPTEAPTVDAMTPAPTPAPLDDTTTVATMTTTSIFGTGTEADNTCIICPDGITAGDDFTPYADDGDFRICADLINDVKLYETGSVACRHSEMLYEPYCCYTKPENPCIICPDGAIAGDDYVPGYAWNSEESWTCKDKIEGAKRFESGSGACRIYDIDVAYCCPPMPMDDSAVATTTTASTLGAGTGVDNPCIICPDGTDIDDVAPYADSGDLRTCADLIDEAKLYETGSDDCGWFEFKELYCCYNKPENPCNICPDGATAGDYYVPEYEGNSVNRKTCKEIIENAKYLESGSDACGLYDLDVAYCCPPMPVDDSAVAPTTTASTLGTGTGVDNLCIICPDGTDIDDFAPYADSGDLRTCADLIDEAKLYETGSDDCGWFEFKELSCCYAIPDNPCNICPDGATAGDEYVPGYEENTVYRLTCKDLIDGAKKFESGSDACGLYDIDLAYCCPPMPVDDSAVAPTTIVSTLDAGAAVNPCIICPDGTAVDDFVPYPSADLRTCAELIDAAKLSEIGSDNCGWFEYTELRCCFTAPEIPCNICPAGATAGDDYVPEYEENSLTCSELIEHATRFESGSDACGSFDIDVPYCCPP